MKSRIFNIAISLSLFFVGCNKFLDKKTDQSLSVGTSANDIQALLDNSSVMNLSFGEGEASADNYYLTYNDWQSLYAVDYRNLYVWGNDLFTDNDLSNNWGTSYQAIYVANTALEKLATIDQSINTFTWNNAYGSALFFRGINHAGIAFEFALGYDSSTSEKTLGIPLRLSSDFNEVSSRSNLKKSYEQIIADLVSAARFLPDQSIHPMRPSREAAFGYLARVFLYLGDYVDASKYADSAFAINGSLLDYNSIDTTASFSFSQFNKEVIFESSGGISPIWYDIAKIDSNLYSNYFTEDLRHILFFGKNTDGTHFFQGSYDGANNIFMGLARDEIYFIKAECMVRLGKSNEAITVLNKILEKRYTSGTNTSSLLGINSSSLLSVILNERRKELIMRDLRWYDVKRLNVKNADISFKRQINTVEYTLSAKSPRFAMPIPDYVIQQSGMQQNLN